MKREFHYIFDPKFQYPGIPKINRYSIDKNKNISIADINIEPVEVMHYKLPVLGFRLGKFAYLTDVKTISDKEMLKLNGWIILEVGKEEHSNKVYSIFKNLHYRNLALIKDFNGDNRVLIAQA